MISVFDYTDYRKYLTDWLAWKRNRHSRTPLLQSWLPG